MGVRLTPAAPPKEEPLIKALNTNYWIDHNGDVYSRARSGTRGGKLKHCMSKTGYPTVMLAPCRRPQKVHRLVAEAFVPNPENKPYVNHKDGDKTNCHYSNLEWVTASENSKHAVETRLLVMPVGEANSASKLDETTVKYLRLVYSPRDKNFGARWLSRKFGVSKSTITRALSGETWCHLK